MDLSRLKFTDHPQNPLIRPPFPEALIADPFVISPQSSPDGLWHLFAHSLIGLRQYTSGDGFSWSAPSSPIFYFAYRPFVYQERGVFYLIYEKILNPLNLPYYDSRLEISSSSNLVTWSPPQTLLSPALPWHKTANRQGNLGNPCLIKINHTYRLYYSSGLIYQPGNGFCEPAFTGYAGSTHLLGPYSFHPRPLTWAHSPTDKHVSAIRVYRYRRQFMALQTVFRSSTSSLCLTVSSDGINWEKNSHSIVSSDKPWKKSYVYVGSLIKIGREFRIYYNARSGRRFGTESIGLATAAL